MNLTYAQVVYLIELFKVLPVSNIPINIRKQLYNLKEDLDPIGREFLLRKKTLLTNLELENKENSSYVEDCVLALASQESSFKLIPFLNEDEFDNLLVIVNTLDFDNLRTNFII